MGTRKKKKKWRKVARTERFSLFQSTTDSRQFEISWKKSNGSYGRRRFIADSIESALAKAEPVDEPIRLIPSPAPAQQGATIAEAFAQTLSFTKRGKLSRGDWQRRQLNFMKWLAKRHPSCSLWSDITRPMLRQYMEEQFKGKAPNTVRMAMQPVQQTAGFMSREYQLPNVAERLGIGNKLAKTPPMVHLVDVLAFCDWVRVEVPWLEAGVTLQGLAGLSMMEALRLNWDRVDLDRGLIEISGEVKNLYRNRVIPVCNRVVEALQRASETQSLSGVETIPAPVVASPEGCSFAQGTDSWKNYTRRVRALVKRWNAELDWASKDLRDCLPTFAISHGIHNDLWEQYIGHAPRSVTARHYLPRLAASSRGNAEALERQMKLFRMAVVQPLEVAIERNGEAEILNFFERGPETVFGSEKVEASRGYNSRV